MPWRFNPFTGNLDETDIPAFNGEVTLGSAASPSIFFTGDPNTGIYSPGADQLALSTNGTGRLFVNASGYVGVGNNTPVAPLHVYNASTGLLFNLVSGTSSSIIQFSNSGQTDSVQIYSINNDLTFRTDLGNYIWRTNNGASEAMRIDSSGRVGIGTSAPATLLHVEAASNLTTDLPFTVQNSADSLRLGIGAYGLSNTVGTSQESDFYYNVGRDHLFQTDGDTKVVIKEGGNVGIGTSSPGELLHVNGNIRVPWNLSTISAYNSDVYNQTINFRGDDRELRISSISANLNPSITFVTGANPGSERARIDSSGRLLVGTSSSPVSGAGQYARLVLQGYTGQATRDGALSIQRGEAAATITSGENIGKISFNDSAGFAFADIAVQADGNAGTNDYPGRLVFSTTADGASSPTEQLRITSDRYVRLASGTGGIQFNGDTASANALDDYEEGTWTPTIVGSTTAGTGTYTFQNGKYTKIGRLVQVVFNVSITAHTGTGNIQVGGIPFAAQGGTGAYFNVRAESLTYTGSQVMCTLDNSTLALTQFSSGSGATAVPLDTSFTLRVTGTYNV